MHLVLFLASILVQGPVQNNPAVLQIRVIEGEGVAYPLGGRATRGVTIQVSDETGRPVEGASVSFRLPEEGPTGTFSNGSRAEIAMTAADGKVSAWGMQWNRLEGSLELRITAVKGNARAGTICPLYLSKVSLENDPPAPGKFGRSHKWLWITVAVAASAGAAVAMAAVSHKASVPIGPTATPTSIGTPTISIGHP